MADAADEDLFADLYDGEDAEPEATRPAPEAPKTEPDAPAVKTETVTDESAPQQQQQQQNYQQQDDDEAKPFDPSTEEMDTMTHAPHQTYETQEVDRTPVHMKDDGKMFIGGLNWETTDQSLKDYFTQFGEVTECTVMRDGVTGRSRGFGFLTFKDPKVVNVVMVKEHLLDGKLIDPKRAIPRDEQEKTSKIFVGGVSQEATETDFRQFFAQFGNVLDCTLMMDKDTGRPRGFGFVTFDDDQAVERALSQPLAIHGKPIEVKRAEPRGNLREEGGGGGGRGGRFGGAGRGGGGAHQNNFGAQQDQAAQAGGANNMSPAMMAQYWQRMQQYFQMMQQQMQGGGMAGGMNPQMAAMQQNPQMMQQMMASMGRGQGGAGGMNPQMMQQMASMQQQQQQQGGGMQGGPGMQQGGGMQGGYSGGSMSGSASPGPGQQQSGFNAQEQMVFEQQKYERQQMARMQGQSVNGGSTWEGMYDDVPAPAGVNNRGGGFAGRGGRGGGAPAGPGGARGPGTPGNAPVNAPTGPKNAGMPGSNYRGGRGGRGGGGGRFDPYARNAK